MEKFKRTKHNLKELEDINRWLLDGSYIKHLSIKLSETESEFKTFCERVGKEFRKCRSDLQDAERHFQVVGDEKEKLEKLNNRQIGDETKADDLKSQLMEISNFPVLDWNESFNALMNEKDTVKVLILNPKSDVSPVEFKSSHQPKHTTPSGRIVSKKRSLTSVRRTSDEHVDLHNSVDNDESRSSGYNDCVPSNRYEFKKKNSYVELKSNTEAETQTNESSFVNNKQDNSTCTENQDLIDGETQTIPSHDATDIVDITGKDENESTDENTDGIRHDSSDDSDDQVGGRRLNDKNEHKRRPNFKRALTMKQLTSSTDYKHSYTEEAVAPFAELIHRLPIVSESNTEVMPIVTLNDDAMSGIKETEGTDDAPTRVCDQLSNATRTLPDMKVSQGKTTPTDVPSIPIMIPNIEIFDDGSVKISSWADLALFENYVVIATLEGLLKIKRNEGSILDKLPMKSILAICKIKGSADIGVLIHQNGIAVVSTDRMVVKYRLKTTKSYSKICHLSTFTDRLPDPSYQFALIISTQTDTSLPGRLLKETVVFAHALPNRDDVLLPTPNYSVYFQKPSFALHDFESINCIGSFDSDSVVLCTPTRVACFKIDKNKTFPLWEIKLRKNATDIVCTELKVYVCIKDEGKIMMTNKHGQIERDNILKSSDPTRPDKISVHGDTIMMKEFQESKWASTLTCL